MHFRLASVLFLLCLYMFNYLSDTCLSNTCLADTYSKTDTHSQISPLSLSDFKSEILFKNVSKDFTLVNVWATICPPCVKELPDLFQFGTTHADQWNVILISTDFRESWPSVPSFLSAFGFMPPYYVKADPDEIFITGLHPEWNGEIPATFIYDRTGQLLTYWTGDKTFDELEDIAHQLTQERSP